MGDVLSSCQKDSAALDDHHHGPPQRRPKMDGASNGTARTATSDATTTTPRKRSFDDDDDELLPGDESTRGRGSFLQRWRRSLNGSNSNNNNSGSSSGILKASTYDQVHERAARQLQRMYQQNNNHSAKKLRNHKTNNNNNNHHPITAQLLHHNNNTDANHYHHHHNAMGVVGLANLGNTCFLNSSLQCLSATIPLTDYFLGYDYEREINRDNPLGTRGRLASAYGAWLSHVWSSGHATSHLRQPVAQFKGQLGQFAPQFQGNQQHDAQELLAFLLDGIHEDLNRVKQKPYIEEQDCDGRHDERDAMKAWKNYLLRNKSIIVDIFQGQLRSCVTCLSCGHVNVRFEPFMYLSLPMDGRCQSLGDCMDLFLQEERLDGDNQWYCSHCQQHRDAKKKIDLWILPPILIVHLKRFRFDDFGRVGSKNTAAIRYPLQDWDLRPYVKSLSSRTNAPQSLSNYDLYAVSNHIGGMGSGHYTAYAKSRMDDQSWYEFNDARTTPVTERVLRQHSASAYLLFYNRTNGKNNNDDNKRFSPRSIPLVRRQSTNRPDLWPHTQVSDMGQVRDFARSSVVKVSVQNLGIEEKDDEEDEEDEIEPLPAKQKQTQQQQQQQPQRGLSPIPKSADEAYEMELQSPTKAAATAITGESSGEFLLL